MAPFEEHEFSYASGEKKTFYLAAGPINGPLLIFCHGWPAIAKTWKAQLETFASLGFRVVAPDMPGYGRSTARKVIEDYSMENVNLSMLALLEHLGSEEAIWIAHDWGCCAVWTFAEQYPEKCVAVCGMAVPARVLELGVEECMKFINREIYPEDKYPNGQWDYQKYYELEFDKATSWFDTDVASCMRVMFSNGSSENLGKPSPTSQVLASGGMFGGIEKPDPKWRDIPIEEMCVDEELYQELVHAMEKTGFFGGNAWYMNHAKNRKYFFERAKNNGYLHMPVLFIEAQFDTICNTSSSRLGEPQRKYCTNLTEASIDAGHRCHQEKPAEVNAVLARWLMESCSQHWPGYWSRGFTRTAKT